MLYLSTHPVSFLFSMGVEYGQNGRRWGMMPHHWGTYGWGGWLMMLVWLIIIALFVYLLFRMANNRGTGRREYDSAMTILKERYARGEISKDEFEKKKHDLRHR